MSPRPLSSLLYVDDDADIREIVEMSLGLDGTLTIETSASGEQALARMRQRAPDLVVLDVMMPGMDGPTVLQHMRAEAGLRDVPVIFMTAKTNAQEMARFRGLSAIGIIAKPFDPMTLGHQVKALWEAR